MQIDAGQLDRRLTLIAPSQSRDAAGQPLETWTGLATLHGAQYALLDKEVRAQAGRTNQAEWKFLVRYRAGITTSERFQCEGRTWEITGVEEIGRRMGLWLFVTEVNGFNGVVTSA